MTLPILRETALLTGLPETALQALAERMELRALPAGTTVVHQGEPGDAWFVVVCGSLEVVTQDLVGQTRMLATLGVGDAFGEIALIRKGPRTATVLVRQDAQLLRLSRAVFVEFARAHPAFADELRARVDHLEVFTFLRTASPLAYLSRGILLELAALVEPLSAASGQTIVQEDEPGERMYLVRSGQVEVVQRGKRLGYLEVGDCFGEVALLGDGRRTATVRATQPADLLALPRATFQAVVGGHAEVTGLLAELARIRHRTGSAPRPGAANALARLAPLVELDRHRRAWVVLVLGTSAFAALSAVTVRVDAAALATLTVLVGAFVGPASFCAFLAEANILSHRWTTLGVAFGLSAGVGLPLAVFVERTLNLVPGGLQVGLAGAVIEEPLKLIGIVWLLRRRPSRFVFDGVIYGAAAGMGFAAFESVLYGLGRADDVSHLLGTLWARTLLAPFGHGCWTALICAAIWYWKANRRSDQGCKSIGLVSLSVGLHALWDWQVMPGGLQVVWLLTVGGIGLGALGVVLKGAATEEAGAILALNPELVSDGNPGITAGARVRCRVCGQAAPRGSHYCSRCGLALRGITSIRDAPARTSSIQTDSAGSVSPSA